MAKLLILLTLKICANAVLAYIQNTIRTIDFENTENNAFKSTI